MVNGQCRLSSASACDNPEVFHGLSTTCANVDCAGACCLPNGNCGLSGEVGCVETLGGEFLGFNVDCAGTECAGACCLPDKGCVETGSGNCEGMDGEYQGIGTVCGEDCPIRMPTAFTYQGQLTQGSVPLNDSIDARFSLWLSPDGQDPANQVASTVQVDSIDVVDGLFHVEIDFGQDAFNGNARWLQIDLRDSGSPDPFTILEPRVSLTPAPYALQTRGIVARDSGVVGIGTKEPNAGLHIKKEALPPGGTLALEGDTHTYLSLFPDGFDAGRKGYFGFATPTTGDITIGNEVTNGRIKFATSNGTVLATGGEENLRIIRGIVEGTGNIIAGLGYSVTRTSVGHYVVSFDTPFTGRPAVTTTLECAPNCFVGLENVSTSGFDFYATLYVGGNEFNWEYRDIDFHFIAAGPR